MRSFYGYIRVSTARQGVHGVSLQEQRDAIERYAERNGARIIQWFEERETAAKRGRPIFNAMLRLLQRGQSEGVIIHKIDRSARNLKDWADLGDLMDAGVQVYFAGDSLDLNTRGGRLSADIQAVVAADYIRNLREEAKKGLYGRLKQGYYPFGAPIGYLDCGQAKTKEFDPVRGPLVRKVFELYGTGRYNLHTLAGEAHRLGLRTRRGGRITVRSLSYMLNNSFYIGLIRITISGETFHGIHQPLIPKSLFSRVQAILRGKTNTRIMKHDFLFRRMLTCGTCDRSLIGERQKGHIYYRCHHSTCKGTSVSQEDVEEVVKEQLGLIHFSDRELASLRAIVEYLKEDWVVQKDKEEKSLRLQLGQTQERLNRLVDAFLDGNVEKDLYEDRKRQLLLDRVDREEQLTTLKATTTSGAEKVLEFVELAKTAQLRYEMGTLDEKRDLVKLVMSNLVVSGKCVSTRLSFPYSEVAKRPEFARGGPQRIIGRTLKNWVLQICIGLLTQDASWKDVDERPPK